MPSLGEYELTRQLGVGGMGEVWMGRRTSIGGAAKTVAIKTISRAHARDPNSRKMFLDEARLSMLLANSNIIQTFNVAETDDGICYMVMEWIDGIDLSALCEGLTQRGERLSTTLAAYIFGEILKGLAYAHSFRHEGVTKTIVHRDISPHNVMISVSGEVKIMDFGIARVASEETSGVHIKGKLRYMPPEQLRGMSRDPTIDLFAAGAILHELLDGSKFRTGIDEARLYGMILDGESPPLEGAVGEIPPELDALRLGLLAADPNERTQSARLAYKQLVKWSGYRDARFELEELIQEHKAARQDNDAGTAALAGGALFPDSSSSSSVGPSGTVVLMDDGSQTELSRQTALEAQTGTDTRRAPEQATEFLPPPPPLAAEPEDAGQRKPLLIGLASVGVLGLAAGLFMLLSNPEDASEGTDEVPAEQSSASGEAEVQPEPVEPVKPDPPKPPPEPVEPEPETLPEPVEPEPVPDDAVEPGPGPDPASKPDAVAKTKVTISAPGYKFWVELRIGSRKLTIDRMKSSSVTTRFKPGSYAVSFRSDPKGGWQSAGKVQIPSGRAVSLQLAAGGKVSVK